MAAESMTWIDSTATSHALNGTTSPKVWALQGRVGAFMPPMAQLDQRTPLRPGTTIRYTDIQPRIITVPLLINANGDETALRTQLRAITKWFALPGTLLATATDGSQRQLTPAYYYAGFDLTEDMDNGLRGPGWVLAPLQLEAPNPFWQDTAATVNNYTNTQLLAGATITNTGDYAAYPTWVFAGPMTNLVITNTTTGQVISMTANGGLVLATGHTLTINTLAGTVIQDTSTNVIGNLTLGSVLFPLAPGANALTFVYTAGVGGTSTGQATYVNQWYSI